MTIFLLRHASPNLSRRDIPYDIHPGPELLPKGEEEARALAEFLKPEGLRKLYFSPFKRSAMTARIVAAANGTPAIEEAGLAEWREVDEPEAQVRTRMLSLFKRVARESEGLGPIGLVSHGGPIALLLLELGMDEKELAPYRTRFDTINPLPPAGAWKAERADGEGSWNLQLVFTPKVI